MSFWKSLAGMVMVEFTSAAPEKVLDLVAKEQIRISHVIPIDELTYRVLIHRRDFRRFSMILERQEDPLKIVSKTGLYWLFNSVVHHRIILSLSVFLLMTSLYFPTRIFFVAVEGNRTIPQRLILSAAETCGINFGASRKQVRSEKVKNELLSALPQLQWVGVNTSGCTALISVRERVEAEEKMETGMISNLIAHRDGYILSATVTSGTAHCLPGETVTKGQLLVSGYTDCGICIRASRAEGEIIAQTNRKMTAVMPVRYNSKDRKGNTKYQIGLLIGKKRINLWKDSRISDTGCGRMYEEYFVSLPGGFQLPFALCVDRYQSWELQDVVIPEDAAKRQLQIFLQNCLTKEMIAGQILQKQEQFMSSDGLYKLEGSYTCTELIGKEQREQIGVINGKRN